MSSEAKEAFIFALDEALNRLEAVVGPHPEVRSFEDAQKLTRDIQNPNFKAATRVRWVVAGARARVKQLESGGWPPFRPDDAQLAMDLIERGQLEAQANTLDPVFQKAVVQALSPLREVIEKYADKTDSKWRFREEDCDPLPEPEIPRRAGT